MPLPSPRTRIVPQLPVSKLPHPWDSTFKLLDQPPAYPYLLTPAMQFRLDMEAADRRIAFYWVIKKKWLPDLKIPANRKYTNLLEPWGELKFRTLELALAWHTLPAAPTYRYRNAADCYLHVMQEAEQIDTEEILSNEPDGKTPFIKGRYAIIAQLKSEANPANPKQSPHFYNLMDASLQLENRDDFYTKYWRPFLHACSRWTQALDKRECQEVYLENDRIVSRLGKGKGKRTIIRIPN